MKDEFQGPENLYNGKLGSVRQGVFPWHGNWPNYRIDTRVKTPRTKENLKGVHPDLVTLWDATLFPYPCQVIDGVRTWPEQQEMYQKGASKTLNSRHLTGHAFDFAVFPDGYDKPASWETPLYIECVKELKDAAQSLKIPCTFGSDWGWDHGHVELSWDAYPVKDYKPKTAANSKTIATASVGVPIVAFLQDIFAGIKSMTGNLLVGVDDSTVGLVQAVALAFIVLFLVWERYRKIKTEGV